MKSHNYGRDFAALCHLLKLDLPYVGLLGPRKRRDQLLNAVLDEGIAIDAEVFAPAGLDLGAETPEELALALVAEIQAAFAGGERGIVARSESADSRLERRVRAGKTMRNLGAVILAAGGSSRLGRPKQLLAFGGETLVRRAVRAALETGCDPVIVVVGEIGDGSKNLNTDSAYRSWPCPRKLTRAGSFTIRSGETGFGNVDPCGGCATSTVRSTPLSCWRATSRSSTPGDR